VTAVIYTICSLKWYYDSYAEAGRS